MVEYTKNKLYARKVLAVLFMHLIAGDSTWLIVEDVVIVFSLRLSVSSPHWISKENIFHQSRR